MLFLFLICKIFWRKCFKICNIQDLVQNTFAPICKAECKCTSTESRPIEVNGSSIGDIPASYRIANIRKHEFPVIGIFVDPRVVPGFKYRVRPLQQNGYQEKWLFKRRALELESVGRGYSRRITFKADRGELNDNPHYFWADSRPEGFAFELELVSVGDKFTVFDASRLPVGTLEIARNQVPQEEVGHRILEDGSVEKTVRIRSLCKVEWYEDSNCDIVVPMSGVAISVKSPKGILKTKLIGVTIGSHPRRGFTLKAGINNRLRSTKVRGESIADVPTTYTITGLDAHELPVIGTYIDPRIIPGFYYRVRPAAGKRRPLFNGKILKLVSTGMGYGKRITFASESLNHPENYFWSDSHPDGLGFEPSAVRAGMKFEILAGNLRLGEATVFRADAPQIEKEQITKKKGGTTLLTKHIHVDVTCHVTIDTRFDKSPEPLIMRISGTAIVTKTNKDLEAQLIRLENIGLDSQLNILFSTQWEKLVFIPI
ncbi:uncharacterized protein isoform X2 [Rhodnius prolixus]|uniref:uncharacterized protein isoform X2 n=1 Tax=Rhodnius prolixus TaxID=13249 RepID=UPI003D18D532